MNTIYEKAKAFIMEKGSAAQKVCFEYIDGVASKEDVVQAIGKYQNPDGGWANGLEVEYQGDISSPMTTAAALSYLHLFDLKDTELMERTLEYLKGTQRADGSWDDVDGILGFPLPEYFGPNKFVEYKTGMIVKWLKRMDLREDELMIRGIDYLINKFDFYKGVEDFWTAGAYLGVFTEFPEAERASEIIEWGIGVMTNAAKGAENNDPEAMPWMQVQGMIYEDDKMLIPLKEKVVEAIRANQLPNGSWPHPFGDYNAVWVAVLISRYLKRNSLV